ncbi:hypothetical protein NK8_61270 (plasmid) [Caballeronia sp. NK8]|uniref:hypothetical protein n=1 Tax=Caballeronia sp. NK8 TaxID=140098 RepID=UPI001BB4FA21|nr:hypothetical protein [Caballeronia sp. NK8]BCQ27938.1 hypothetical protein NK8_61270 [Caballeronia sp. NK8]
MKAKTKPQFFAMMAACALVTTVGSIGAAHAQGMPADAQQTVQTMRPMYMSQATPDHSQTAAMPAPQADESAYGGMSAGASASASGRRQGGCGDAPRCDIFFGQ